MGRFVNPDNSAFQVALNSDIYIDKTGLLEYTNSVLDTKQSLICNSRPRQFGKSITADMLAAYYSRGCDSGEMFSGLAISRNRDFQKHLNQYDVIHLDIQWCMSPAGSDDVLTLLIHLGYLAFNKKYQSAYIPNEEIRQEFLAAVKAKK